MIVAATADVHSPRYFEDFVSALENLAKKPDLFLIAGDMIHRGEVKEYEKIANALFGKISVPIVACFGNSEFQQIREELKVKHKEIRFLDDQALALRVCGKSVGIVGSTGCLEKPTKWQRANIPDIERIYATRLELLKVQLQRLLVDFKILLLHYAPTYKTLEGENPLFYGSMGWNVLENVLLEQRPNLVIHAHSHRGTKMAWVDTVPVFNVSFALNKEIVLIDTEKLKPGLTKFVEE